MSAKTGDTEIELLETPTPPKHNPVVGQDGICEDLSEEERSRLEDCVTEESGEDSDERYIYDSDDSDVFSGDIECCISLPSFKCLKSKQSQKEELNRTERIDAFLMKAISQISILTFISFSVVWLLVGYVLPACLCETMFGHLIGLPFTVKLTIFILLMFFSFMAWLTMLVAKSITYKKPQGVFSLIIMLISLFMVSVVGNLICIAKAGSWTTYLIYSEDFYHKAGKAFMKDDMITAFKTLSQLSTSADVRESMSKFFYPEGLFQIEAIERTIKWFMIGGWFIFNVFLIFAIMSLIKYRKFYYEGYLDPDEKIHMRKSQLSLKSQQSKKNKRSRRSRPPSYNHVSSPKSDYTVNTARSSKTAVTSRTVHSPTFSSRTMNYNRPSRNVSDRNDYYTIQKQHQRKNREDFLY